jgi:hypothetical protein
VRDASVAPAPAHDGACNPPRWRLESAAVLRAAPALAILHALVSIACPARARADEGDTVYGRLAADVTLSAGLGGGLALGDRGGPDVTGTTTLELRARIVDSGGLVLAPEWRPEGDSRVFVGIDLRPLFLMRFLTNSESGDRYVDLLVDSIGIDLGAALGPFDDELGVALGVGLGIDVPLFLPDATSGGLFLRLSTRWTHAEPTGQHAPPGGVNDLVVLGVLTVRGIVDAGIARWEPSRYRMPDDD